MLGENTSNFKPLLGGKVLAMPPALLTNTAHPLNVARRIGRGAEMTLETERGAECFGSQVNPDCVTSNKEEVKQYSRPVENKSEFGDGEPA